MNQAANSSDSVIGKVSHYISKSAGAKLPAKVVTKAKHHILDSLAAVVSGSTLESGQLAAKFIATQQGTKEAQVVGTKIVTTAINAALVNGMSAHGDETDDTAPRGQHPGCNIVPAALAVAEKEGADGMTFLKGVVTGYEFGQRMVSAFEWQKLTASGRDVHGWGGTFGSTTAAASVLRLKPDPVAFALSYACEQASGMGYWPRDIRHIEKAFLFGGMPARNGVTAAVLAQAGFPGIEDPFSGKANVFEPTAPYANPEILVEGLGKNYSIMLAAIKKYPIGNPIQAPMDAVLNLIKKYPMKAGEVKSVGVYMPSVFRPVDGSSMPNVNLQHLMAVTLIDKKLTYETTHSHERMSDPEVVSLRNRVKLVEDPGMFTKEEAKQQPVIIEIIKTDNTKLVERLMNIRGSAENPLTAEEVAQKADGLMAPVIGARRSLKLIDSIFNIECVEDVRSLRTLLRVR